MPVTLRNTRRGPLAFSVPTERGTRRYIWAGAGDPSGGDIQEIPNDLMQDVQIRKVVARGFLVEEDEAAGRAAQQKQIDAAEARREQAASFVMDTLDPAANHDLVSVPCQGPNGRGTADCGAPVPVREADKGKAPALCPQHEALASQFIQVPTGEMVQVGDALVAEQRWVRPTVESR